MRKTSMFIAIVMGAWVALISGPAGVLAQETASDAEPAGDASPVVELAPEAQALLATPVGELRLRVAPETAAQIEVRLETLMDALRTVAVALTDRVIELQRLAVAADAGEEFEAASGAVESLRILRADTIARTTVLLDGLEAKGGDVAAGRQYVAVVGRIEPELSEGLADAAEAAPEDIESRVSNLIAFVRDQPPVHERPEPWSISVDELILELQPLQLAQIDERVQIWISILQREIRERIRIDIALGNSTDEAEQQALARRSSDQQRIVLAIVQRIQAMLTLVNARGGEVDAYERYITNATGQKLNVTNPNILYAQVLAWLKSSDGGIRIGLNVLEFLAVLVAFWLVGRIFGAAIGAALRRSNRTSNLLRDFLVVGTRRSFIFIGAVIGVSMLGVNIGPLLAAIGAAGLVIGLALQGTLSNFATGLLILAYRPFDVGDVVSAGGVLGKVDTVTLMSTRLLSFDNQVMLVPNNQIWGAVITNLTKLSTRRVDLVFGIGYGDDIDKAESIIRETVAAHPMVLESPEPTIKVNELGDNSVNFIVRPWAQTAQYWDVYWDLTKQIKQRFDEAGINIPFPQRDLHIDGPIEVVLDNSTRLKGGSAPG